MSRALRAAAAIADELCILLPSLPATPEERDAWWPDDAALAHLIDAAAGIGALERELRGARARVAALTGEIALLHSRFTATAATAPVSLR